MPTSPSPENPTLTPPPKGWRTAAVPAPVPVAPPVQPPPSGESLAILERYKRDLHNSLVNSLDSNRLSALPADRQRAELSALIAKAIASDPPPVARADERLLRELLDEILGFGPLEILLRDPTITDILVNGPKEVYVERNGKLALSDVTFRDDQQVMQVLDRIVSKVGRRIDESSPMVDARLPDGSRVNAVIAPLSVKFPAISIRRFGGGAKHLDDLVGLHMLAPEMALFLKAAVKARLNIIVSGGTGSGKTTLLNALSRFIPETERIVTIEDAVELQLQQRHVVTLESRPQNVEGKGQVTIRDLVRNALRMRPDRIVVGECRGAEALDMLQAMNTGHDGSLTTLHANTPRDVLARLETMVMMAGFDLPVKAIRQQVASAVNIIVQTARLQGGARRVTSITELTGMEGETITLQDVFRYHQSGVNGAGKAFGTFEATGIRPHATERIQTAGVVLPPDVFQQRTLAPDEAEKGMA
ncbi:Putative conjugal transfer protein [Gemmata sp. SH-PL17]|uniref:CpaF family protein n=1 Tax=Gemmata sp. SH-PL17 TaxID=1630693 RepID=UPI0004B293D9|nr:CpaF family protein [Gemmata sp. SH-PL17]AMV29530.1 Putative conjugal transfer protein [Gemmata sp. SH-PL17]